MNESVRGRQASRAQSVMDCCVRRRYWTGKEEQRREGGQEPSTEGRGEQRWRKHQGKGEQAAGFRRRLSGRQGDRSESSGQIPSTFTFREKRDQGCQQSSRDQHPGEHRELHGELFHVQAQSEEHTAPPNLERWSPHHSSW